MKFLEQLRTQFLAQWRQMSFGQRLSVGLGAALTLALVGLLIWLNRPVSYETLFSGLEPEDSAALRAELTSMAIPFQQDQGGASLLIPSERVPEVRLALAGRGMFENRAHGFELFDGSSLGMTEFLQNVNYHRAMEGELARSIATLQAVERVRVHLVLPRQSLFLEEKTEPKASVVLKLRSGRRLAQEEIDAICQLVSASVEGLKPEAVRLISDRGELLSSSWLEQARRGSGGGAAQFEEVSRLEGEVSSKIIELLSPIVGAGKVRARATIDLDQTRTDETLEVYDPDKSVVRNQATERSSARSIQAGGVAGAASNVGDNGGLNSTDGGKEQQKETIHYEVSKSVRRILDEAGRVRRLSIAVVVDDRLELDAAGNPKRSSWTPEQLQKLQEIVAAAVGMDSKRGDVVQVNNFSFAAAEMADSLLGDSSAQENSSMSAYSMVAIVGLAVLLGFGALVVLRRRAMLRLEQVQIPPQLTSGGPRSLEQIEAELTGALALDGALGPSPQVRRATQLKEQILEHVKSDPLLVTELIRTWVIDAGIVNQEHPDEEESHVESGK